MILRSRGRNSSRAGVFSSKIRENLPPVLVGALLNLLKDDGELADVPATAGVNDVVLELQGLFKVVCAVFLKDVGVLLA